jgi:hypothetical protein
MSKARTLVIVLEQDRREIRVPEVARAAEITDSVVALDDKNCAMARFKKEDVRSWFVE